MQHKFIEEHFLSKYGDCDLGGKREPLSLDTRNGIHNNIFNLNKISFGELSFVHNVYLHKAWE